MEKQNNPAKGASSSETNNRQHIQPSKKKGSHRDKERMGGINASSTITTATRKKLRPQRVPRSTKDKKWTWKKPKGKPKRSLSSYNYFFQRERKRILRTCSLGKKSTVTSGIGDSTSQDGLHAENNGTKSDRKQGVISFADLTKKIGEKWNSLDDLSRSVFDELAAIDKRRYEEDIIGWREERISQDQCQEEGVKNKLKEVMGQHEGKKRPWAAVSENTAYRAEIDLFLASSSLSPSSSLKPPHSMVAQRIVPNSNVKNSNWPDMSKLKVPDQVEELVKKKELHSGASSVLSYLKPSESETRIASDGALVCNDFDACDERVSSAESFHSMGLGIDCPGFNNSTSNDMNIYSDYDINSITLRHFKPSKETDTKNQSIGPFDDEEVRNFLRDSFEMESKTSPSKPGKQQLFTPQMAQVRTKEFHSSKPTTFPHKRAY